jgi:hypothetical protein
VTDDRKAGIALIAGSLGGMLTMHLHPSGAVSITTPAQLARLAAASAAVHSLALISVLVLFLGACGLARRLGAPDRISFAAIVTYGFACVAVMTAAAVSGFVVPQIVKHMLQDAPANAHEWQVVTTGIFQINQAMAQIFSVGASIAIILWSISVLRNGGLSRWVAIYGCVVALLIAVAISSGHLTLDVRGMAAVMLGQAIWFIATGVQLCGPNVDLPANEKPGGSRALGEWSQG